MTGTLSREQGHSACGWEEQATIPHWPGSAEASLRRWNMGCLDALKVPWTGLYKVWTTCNRKIISTILWNLFWLTGWDIEFTWSFWSSLKASLIMKSPELSWRWSNLRKMSRCCPLCLVSCSSCWGFQVPSSHFLHSLLRPPLPVLQSPEPRLSPPSVRTALLDLSWPLSLSPSLHSNTVCLLCFSSHGL